MSGSALQPHGTIGPYRIVARVGAGGMGEVFKGWDPRLKRDVAVKRLHADSTGNADRQRRLLSEGQAASALNHPNIVRVYDAGVDDGSYYLVSEWLEGRSLRDELDHGPPRLKRLLNLAIQIADGLAHAHAAGIVHRDIKPENVMLAGDGTARIVDFGLARSEGMGGASDATTQTSTLSVDGGVSGTPAYMSPEQARAAPSDFRSDQFSLGVLMYEMAAGTSPFARATLADTLAAVLHEEPKPLAEVAPRLPVAFRWIVEQCLAKDPAERYAATEDLARDLRRTRDRLAEIHAEPAMQDEATAPWKRLAFAAAAVAAAVAGLAFAAGVVTRPAPPSYSFLPFASASEYEGAPAWSPDGQTVAYVADVDGVLQLFVKRVGDALGHQVTQGRFDAQRPFWAPNSQLLYFISPAGESDALWSVGVAGGRPELVVENVARAAIDPDGTRIAMFRTDPALLFRESLWWLSLPASGPPVRELRPPFDTVAATSDQLAFSGDGQLLLWVYRITSGEPASRPAPPDFYILPKDGGPPRRVLSGVERLSNLPAFSWLPDNRHVVLALPDARLGNRHLWLADTRSAALTPLTATHTNETDPAVAPDGHRLVYATDEVDFDLVRISPDGAERGSQMATARNEFSPLWSPSGDQFAFVTDRSGALEIFARSRDGQFERPIVTTADFPGSPTQTLGSLAFSPDGKTLAYQRGDGGTFEIWLSPASGGTPVRLTPSTNVRIYQDAPAWSPDGEWIAYSFTELENQRQSLRKMRVGGTESLVLTDSVASFSPVVWSADGRWIYYQTFGGLARIPAGGGTPDVIFSDNTMAFAAADDGKRLFALVDSDTSGHFALAEIDPDRRTSTLLNPDLGPVPIANQPIRGLSFAKGQGFLTSLARARSDLWLLEGLEPSRGWLARLSRLGR